MKRLPTLLALLAAVALWAQPVEVRVCSDAERLPYAYVFVNGRIVGSADSTGCIRIPRQRLSVGDTLGASYVGLRDTSVIYRGGDSCTLALPGAGIASVTILPDNENLRRKIRRRKYRDFHQSLAGRYALRRDTLRITGRFEYRIVPDRTTTYDIRMEFWPDPGNQVLSSSETALLQQIVNAESVGTSISRQVASNRGLRILYEGRDPAGSDTYTVIRPAVKMAEELPAEQAKFYVDPLTRDVERCITGCYFPRARLETDTRYAFLAGYAYPARIRARLHYDDGRETCCEFTEITFDPEPRKR